MAPATKCTLRSTLSSTLKRNVRLVAATCRRSAAHLRTASYEVHWLGDDRSDPNIAVTLLEIAPGSATDWELWLGARRLSNADAWSWTDGEPFVYTNWAAGTSIIGLRLSLHSRPVFLVWMCVRVISRDLDRIRLHVRHVVFMRNSIDRRAKAIA